MNEEYTKLPSGLEYCRDWERTDGAVVMRNVKTLNRYHELVEERDNLNCYSYDCFFAFSNEQFEEGAKRIRPLKEGEKYVSCGAGLYGTRNGVDKYFAAIAEYDKQIKQECDPQEVYFYEYNNHECFISWDGDEPAYNIVERIWGEERASQIVRIY